MDTEQFEKLLEQGQDNALLRFTLGKAYLEKGEAGKACEHLAAAVRHDPDYSAAWKIYGKALAEKDDKAGAADAFRSGIEVAQRRGDKQAAKEMQVFLKRLERET